MTRHIGHHHWYILRVIFSHFYVSYRFFVHHIGLHQCHIGFCQCHIGISFFPPDFVCHIGLPDMKSMSYRIFSILLPFPDIIYYERKVLISFMSINLCLLSMTIFSEKNYILSMTQIIFCTTIYRKINYWFLQNITIMKVYNWLQKYQ